MGFWDFLYDFSEFVHGASPLFLKGPSRPKPWPILVPGPWRHHRLDSENPIQRTTFATAMCHTYWFLIGIAELAHFSAVGRCRRRFMRPVFLVFFFSFSFLFSFPFLFFFLWVFTCFLWFLIFFLFFSLFFSFFPLLWFFCFFLGFLCFLPVFFWIFVGFY